MTIKYRIKTRQYRKADPGYSTEWVIQRKTIFGWIEVDWSLSERSAREKLEKVIYGHTHKRNVKEFLNRIVYEEEVDG